MSRHVQTNSGLLLQGGPKVRHANRIARPSSPQIHGTNPTPFFFSIVHMIHLNPNPYTLHLFFVLKNHARLFTRPPHPKTSAYEIYKKAYTLICLTQNREDRKNEFLS